MDVVIKARAPIFLDVALSVGQGESLALIGRSGSGKSTLLRAIAGLYAPQGGRVRVASGEWYNSEANVSLPTHRRRVGLVFQSYALFPHLDTLGNVMAALGDGLPRHEKSEKATALLEIVELHRLEHRYPSELSGGQQQRVAIARALAREPEVLLLDEPFSAVDRIARRRLQAQIASLRQRTDVPIILVSHDIDDARRLSDRIAIMEGGRIIQSGAFEDIANHPANAAVGELIALDD
nr:ABC transporter ATP-binding protein [Pelagibacterium limicola]